MTAEQRSEPLVGASDTWQRVHPLSPMIHMWAVIVGVVAVVLFQQASLIERLREWLVETGIPGIVLVPMVLGGTVIAVVVASAVGWILSLPWWRATGWRMDAEEIRVRHGVLSKNLRTARFDRVQSVDLVEPLLARILRLAGVRIETAGGTGSAVTVEYLPREQAEALREVLLARVHGEPVLADRATAEAAGVAVVVVAETTVVAPIPIGKSIIAAALTGPTMVTLVGVILSMSTPVGIAVLLPTLAGVIPWLWTLLNRSWRFTATSSDGVLGLTFGFSERRRQSVPLERIHGMSISQPVLWRLLDWWKVEVSTAGYGHPEKSGATTAVLPVGSLQQAVEMVALLGPLDIAEVDELVRPDRPMLRSTSSSTSTASSITRYTSPRSARWVSPLDQSRQGVVLVGEPLRAVICRHGRLRRTSEVIDPCHIQELSYRRGPVHRLLGLASVRLDLVPGVVSMTGRDLSHPDAMELFIHLRQRQLPAPDRHEAEDIVC